MIIVESGVGVTGANSYASVEAITAYHALRLNDDWAEAMPAEQVSAAVRATDYLEANYRAPALPLVLTQGLQWPTALGMGVPPSIIAATAVLALHALSGPLEAPAERGTKTTTRKLEGVGELTTTFDDEGPADPFPHITAMLAGVASPRFSTSSRVSFGRVIR